MKRSLSVTFLLIAPLFLLAMDNCKADDAVDILGKYKVDGKPKRTVNVTKHGDTFHLECVDPSLGLCPRINGVGIMHNGFLAVSYPSEFAGPYYFGPPGGTGPLPPTSVVIVYKISKDKLEGQIGAFQGEGKIKLETLIREK